MNMTNTHIAQIKETTLQARCHYLIAHCILIGFMGISASAQGASTNLSESDACRMATAQLLNKQGGEQKVEIKVDGCTKFVPIFHRGLAQIDVVYSSSHFSEYMKARYDTKDLSDRCSFVRNGRGWQIDRCK